MTIDPAYAIIARFGMKATNKPFSWLVVLLLCNTPALTADKPWREIHSLHFRVITNGSEGAGRRVAREFEQMRAMFVDQFPGFRVDPPAPLLILAPLDESTTRKLLPEFWQHGGPKPAGVFFHGWEKEYAVVRLDAIDSDEFGSDAFSVVYHEYIHSLLHLNFRYLPTWLDEGLAQFYGYTRFEHDHTYIGAPPRNIGRMVVLYRRPVMPLEKLLEQRGSFTKNEDDTDLFYAESWALTHFLTLGPDMNGGVRFKKFMSALQAGTDQKKAFQDSFGDMGEVEKNLENYVHLFAFKAGVVPTPPRADEKSFSVRSMTVGETEAELASFYLSTGHVKEAEASLEVALKEGPKLALAHEEKGFLDLRQGKDAEAIGEFSQAVELDSHMYRSLFAKTMLSPLPHSTAPVDQELLHTTFLKVLDGNLQFAPAYVELAKLAVAQGDFTRALAVARTAEKIEPSRAGYHLLTGQILLRAGHPAEAAAHAAYVATRWSGADHDEAMELWNQVPPAQRPAEAPSDPSLGELQSVEGIVKSVSCEDKQPTLALDQSGKDTVFKLKNTAGGFADTLWFGADHFSLCFHITGLRAVIRYKPGTDKSSPGDVVSWGLRDDLPPAPATPVQATGH